MKAEGVGARRLEDMLGLPRWTFRGLLDPKRLQAPSVDRAAEIASALGIELYLGPPRVGEKEAPADPGDFLQIPILDVALAAGGSRVNGNEDVVAHLAFRKDWLRGLGITSASAVIARAEGDSMVPTIRDGDMMLIDRARSEPPKKLREPNDRRLAPIYALLDGDGSRVKRLELAAPGLLALVSDNPETPTEYRPLSGVSIIGKVMWWGHTNRE